MYTGRTDVITLRHAYSGRTQTAMSLTAHASWRSGRVYDGYIKHVRSPYVYRAPLGLDEDKLLDLCVQDLEETLATVTDGKIAAFMAEPIQGVGGFIVLPRDYFKRILPIVREAGGLLIVDEVQTGWGRTGDHMCAIQHWGVEPDIMVFAKGIANGSPVGVTVTRPEIAAAVDKLTIATFGGNPVGMATTLATIEYIEKHDLAKNAAVQGARLREALEALQARHPFIGDVRGMGLMQGLELVVPDGSKAPDPARATAFVNAAREHGLLLGKGGLYGNAIRVAPPLTVSAAEVDEAAELMGRALADVA
jgi:4-aminobutyrate aminotransferase-like enzyme